jgi:hypothetical protein
VSHEDLKEICTTACWIAFWFAVALGSRQRITINKNGGKS